MSPRSKKVSAEMRAQSRSALIKAARKLFAELGYFNCKVSDIAREAGMSQGNVYWYFSSKDELLKAVLADGFDTLGDALAQSATDSGSCIQKLDALIDRVMSFAQERGDFNTIMLSVMGHGGDALFAQLGFNMSQIGAGYTQSVTSILSQGQQEGILDDDIDPGTLAMLFFALFNGLNLTYGQEWLNVPKAITRNATLRLIGVREFE